MFDFLKDGRIGQFYRLDIKRLRDSFLEYKRANGIEWDVVFWPDPNHGDCVLSTRTDGLTKEELEGLIKTSKHPNRPPGCYSDKFILDPVAWNNSFPPDHRVKPSTKNLRPSAQRWEKLAVGDQKTVSIHTRDLRIWLMRAMALRGLDWVFELERHRDLETTKIPVWTVKRIK